MKQKDLVLLLGSSCIVVLAWIGFSFFNKSVTSTLDETLSQTVKPIAGTFDTETLQKVKNRQIVLPVYTSSDQPVAASSTARTTPTPAVTRTTTPTPPAQGVTVTPAAQVQI